MSNVVDMKIVKEMHPRLERHIKHRLQSIKSEKGLDWATAEVSFGDF
jgi:probable 2-oxoglutarate dehydrogenase E1 component DHKTD1